MEEIIYIKLVYMKDKQVLEVVMTFDQISRSELSVLVSCVVFAGFKRNYC